MTRRLSITRLALIGLLLIPAGRLAGQPSAIEPLERQVREIISEYSGEIGVAIEHIESGRRLEIEGHKRFPLASVYKLGILVETFRQAESGTFTLSDRIEIRPEVRHPWGQVMSRFEPGLKPTIRDLAYWMVVETDNLATDLLLDKVGSANINATLKKLGLGEVTVDRPAKELILAYSGFTDPKYAKLSYDELAALDTDYDRLLREYAEMARTKGPLPPAIRDYGRDPRDSGSPAHINKLIVSIFKGEMVSREASKEMLGMMLQCRTGTNKIPGLLPPGTPVAHKTGDWPSSNNDAGIIFLPDGKGHVAVTVLDNNMMASFEDSGRMIARVARAAYDFFVSNR